VKHLEQMQAQYPGYGDQQHQRDYCARMDRMQELMPCPYPENGPGGKHHQHSTGCYPAAVVEAAVREQIAAAKAAKAAT